MIRDKSFALLDVYFSEKFHNANVVTKETVSYAAIISIYSAIKLNDPCHSITLVLKLNDHIYIYLDLKS